MKSASKPAGAETQQIRILTFEKWLLQLKFQNTAIDSWFMI